MAEDEDIIPVLYEPCSLLHVQHLTLHRYI
jgi:hypothetical protein